MFTPHDEMNPRNLREKFQVWIGKKVIVGTTSFHYLCGRWKSIDAYDALFEIGPKELRVKMNEIETIAEAPPAQAEYFK